METIDYVQAPNLLNKIRYSDSKCIAVIDSCVAYLEIYEWMYSDLLHTDAYSAS